MSDVWSRQHTEIMATPRGKRKREIQDENFENFPVISIPFDIKRRKTDTKYGDGIKVNQSITYHEIVQNFQTK